MRRLRVEDNSEWVSMQPLLPAAVTAAMFSSQSSTLQDLRFLAVDVGMVADQFAALTALARLTCLEVRRNCTYCAEKRVIPEPR